MKSSADIYIGIANVAAQLLIAVIAIGAVLASLHANKKQIASSEKQLNKQIEESRRLATEERQHSSRPIIAPKEEMKQTTAISYDMNTGQSEGERLYTTDHLINWAYGHAVRISLENIGKWPGI